MPPHRRSPSLNWWSPPLSRWPLTLNRIPVHGKPVPSGASQKKGRSRGELCGAPDSGPFYFSAGLLFSASYDIPVFSAVSFRTYFPESTFRRQALTGYQLQLPQISSISSGVIRLSISRMRSI